MKKTKKMLDKRPLNYSEKEKYCIPKIINRVIGSLYARLTTFELLTFINVWHFDLSVKSKYYP